MSNENEQKSAGYGSSFLEMSASYLPLYFIDSAMKREMIESDGKQSIHHFHSFTYTTNEPKYKKSTRNCYLRLLCCSWNIGNKCNLKRISHDIALQLIFSHIFSHIDLYVSAQQHFQMNKHNSTYATHRKRRTMHLEYYCCLGKCFEWNVNHSNRYSNEIECFRKRK